MDGIGSVEKYNAKDHPALRDRFDLHIACLCSDGERPFKHGSGCREVKPAHHQNAAECPNRRGRPWLGPAVYQPVAPGASAGLLKSGFSFRTLEWKPQYTAQISVLRQQSNVTDL